MNIMKKFADEATSSMGLVLKEILEKLTSIDGHLEKIELYLSPINWKDDEFVEKKT